MTPQLAAAMESVISTPATALPTKTSFFSEDVMNDVESWVRRASAQAADGQDNQLAQLLQFIWSDV